MTEVEEGFNEFFVSVGPNLAGKIIPPEEGCAEQSHGVRNLATIFLKKVDDKEMMELVNKFKNKKSTDWNGVDMYIVKEVISAIVVPLTYICNLSFQVGYFPDKMKIAKVIPLFKAGDKKLYTNYRPVAILSQFSKILEKLFVARLDCFVEKCKLLIDCQYGFRDSTATSMALMDLMEELSSAVNEKKFAVGVFIDLKKAFDTIDHDIVLEKMERFGVRGVGLEWSKSYFRHRSQYVQVGDAMSKPADITCGVPRGSIVGPKLFIMYINDICKVSNICNIRHFCRQY